ncbi:MAG: 2-dehydropantoate 2-reductase [Alphaproteobacteria bacterium]|nr:2-dehydropantoate 2-reductase [Alphaproteobacteria bacterium]
MKIAVVGAGAMGGSYGGLLAKAGHEVTLIDIWEEHVAAINTKGLRIDGVFGEHVVEVPARTAPEDNQTADMVIVFTDTNNTEDGAKTAAGLLGNDGFAITFQNGIGNVETLQRVIGPERVLAGSSMCSAARHGPGHVDLTHQRYTSVGEIDGSNSERALAVVAALEGAGFNAKTVPDVMATIWEKFVVNCGFNAIAATTGLRSGEISQVPETAAFQHKVLDEVMAVVNAKGITLPNPHIAKQILVGAGKSFNKPSMLQHVEAGRKTEIDAINGALLSEGEALGVPTPANEALVALLKGRELAQMRAVNEPDLDYNAWQARLEAEAS